MERTTHPPHVEDCASWYEANSLYRHGTTSFCQTHTASRHHYCAIFAKEPSIHMSSSQQQLQCLTVHYPVPHAPLPPHAPHRLVCRRSTSPCRQLPPTPRTTRSCRHPRRLCLRSLPLPPRVQASLGPLAHGVISLVRSVAAAVTLLLLLSFRNTLPKLRETGID